MNTKCYIFQNGKENQVKNDLFLLHEDPEEIVVLTRYGKVHAYQKDQGWTVVLESDRTERIWCPTCGAFVDTYITDSIRGISVNLHPECGSEVTLREPSKRYIRERIVNNGG